MTIDDMKTLMDEFDPAALLPELDTIMGKMELLMRIAVLIGPVLLLVMGLLYLLAAPREANYYFGYRCYFGMGSVDAWRFTQRLAGIVWGLLGLGLGAVMLLKSGGFAEMEIMDMLWEAVGCVIWEAALTAISCILINVIVAIRFDSKGEYRLRKEK